MQNTCGLLNLRAVVRCGLLATLFLSSAAWAEQAAQGNPEKTASDVPAAEVPAPAVPQPEAAAKDATPSTGGSGAAKELGQVTVIGYRTRAATSATGIVTDIIDTPLSISAINSQFISDVGATQSMDAIGSLTGVTGQSNSGETQTNFAVRGFAITPQVDGFDSLANVSGLGSTVGVDRIEVLKGPSAVFNGNVPPGGSINIIYKKPQFRSNETYVQAEYGSWSHRDVELFSSGPITKKFAYLVDLYDENSDGWVDWTQRKEKDAVLGFTVKPITGLSLNANYRYMDTNARVSTLPVSHPGFIGSGVPQDTYLDAWVAQNYGPNEPPQTATVPQYLPGGARYNVLGPQNYNKEQLSLWTTEVAYRNDFMEIRDAYAHTSYTWGVLTLLQSGAKVLGPDGNVSTFFGSSGLLGGEQKGSGWENKLETVFHFDTGFINHALLLGYQASGSGVDYFRVWVGPAQVGPSGQSWNFFTDGPILLQNEFDALRAVSPKPNYQDVSNVGQVQTHAYYLAEQMSMFDDRVHVLLGVRRTKTGGDGIDVSDTTPQFGIVGKPFPRNSFFAQTAFFANYSKSFTPSGIVQPGTTTVVPPAKGTGKEFGVKTAWLNGAVTSTISFFRDDLTNIATPDYSDQGQGGDLVKYNLGGVGRAQGMEAEVTWVPIKALQLSANFTNLPVAEYLQYPGVPQQVGLRFPGTPKRQANLTAKYSFDTGPLAGLYLGTWIHTQTGTRGIIAGDWHYGVELPDLTQVSAFAGYKYREFDVRLNVDNLTDRGGYVMNNAFQPQSPRAYFLTVRYTLPHGWLNPEKS
jgi:iron complex outermembrane recepter protein